MPRSCVVVELKLGGEASVARADLSLEEDDRLVVCSIDDGAVIREFTADQWSKATSYDELGYPLFGCVNGRKP